MLAPKHELRWVLPSESQGNDTPPKAREGAGSSSEGRQREVLAGAGCGMQREREDSQLSAVSFRCQVGIPHNNGRLLSGRKKVANTQCYLFPE